MKDMTPCGQVKVSFKQITWRSVPEEMSLFLGGKGLEKKNVFRGFLPSQKLNSLAPLLT
jgi:hypothetical protein